MDPRPLPCLPFPFSSKNTVGNYTKPHIKSSIPLPISLPYFHHPELHCHRIHHFFQSPLTLKKTSYEKTPRPLFPVNFLHLSPHFLFLLLYPSPQHQKPQQKTLKKSHLLSHFPSRHQKNTTRNITEHPILPSLSTHFQAIDPASSQLEAMDPTFHMA